MSERNFSLPPATPNMPMVKPSRFARWFGRTALRLTGWRVVGEFPDVPKLVMIVAPHSSNWDGFLGFAVKFAVGFEVRVMGKTQLFWWPLGPLLRKLGGIPLDRKSPRGVVEQAVALIRQAPRMWYVITPEGTRKRVEKWKVGFWKIAHGAEIPIFPVYFDYPSRTVGLGPLFHTSADMHADIAAIRTWYRPWRGKHRDTL
ncbi:lysophospholipid acyltransferase family protein [Xanthomonas translucens pv. translucens]|nr:lysophospholipid acyltransferase family protein [Xanthomonas translucens]KTF41662.1 acyltransferase [Xanthomonas translucens pv. translucens]MCT8273825.1 lysophospholipid acyltransferase family protein [Xanthomonas translucens pv. translucens]MCT8277731.1 lysophospholipid acyltransferase family protein [Xanthomonas translucens pv. translucens]MCT8306842.1 lysophospholipid acyltransferase family protein [Xanthomonas translucens pv. translucens]QSQ33553.1 lysophospholipid acyltransferase fami